MEKALIISAAAPLYGEPGAEATLVGEALFGDTVHLAGPAADGFCQVTTADGCQGYAREADLLCDTKSSDDWNAYGKMAARVPWLDVMAAPDAGAARLADMPRGGLVHPLGQANEDGWMPVGLPGGRHGYAKQGNLMPHGAGWEATPPDQLREALGTSALSYLGTQYRLGGKTPQGIDAAGLCAMTYRLNGCVIPCSVSFAAGGPLHQIPRDALALGDLIYFTGHVAMYLGDNKYVHATGYNGSDAVVISTLDTASPFCRHDLAEDIRLCASLF